MPTSHLYITLLLIRAGSSCLSFKIIVDSRDRLHTCSNATPASEPRPVLKQIVKRACPMSHFTLV